jgi:hypothetical protein
MNKPGKKKASASIVWQIDLSQLINKPVVVETREGFNRTATLTEVRYDSTDILGNVVEYPVAIVLDGDDPIPFTQLLHLKLSQ